MNLSMFGVKRSMITSHQDQGPNGRRVLVSNFVVTSSHIVIFSQFFHGHTQWIEIPPHLRCFATIPRETLMSVFEYQISQGSVAEHLRCGGVVNTNLLLSVRVEIWKSYIMWWILFKNFVACFLDHLIYLFINLQAYGDVNKLPVIVWRFGKLRLFRLTSAAQRQSKMFRNIVNIYSYMYIHTKRHCATEQSCWVTFYQCYCKARRQSWWYLYNMYVIVSVVMSRMNSDVVISQLHGSSEWLLDSVPVIVTYWLLCCYLIHLHKY